MYLASTDGRQCTFNAYRSVRPFNVRLVSSPWTLQPDKLDLKHRCSPLSLCSHDAVFESYRPLIYAVYDSELGHHNSYQSQITNIGPLSTSNGCQSPKCCFMLFNNERDRVYIRHMARRSTT